MINNMELITFILIFGTSCYFLGWIWGILFQKYYDYKANKIKKDKDEDCR